MLPVAFLALFVAESVAPPLFPLLFINELVTGVEAFVVSSDGACFGEGDESSLTPSADDGATLAAGGEIPLPFLATTPAAFESGGITVEVGEKFSFFSAVVVELAKDASEAGTSPPW